VRKTSRNLLHGALLEQCILFVHPRFDCASIRRVGCTLWNYGTGRAFSCRRAITMTLSLRREHSQFLRSAIRHPPINAFAPSDKSDEPATARALHLMNQIRCEATDIVWSIILRTWRHESETWRYPNARFNLQIPNGSRRSGWEFKKFELRI